MRFGLLLGASLFLCSEAANASVTIHINAIATEVAAEGALAPEIQAQIGPVAVWTIDLVLPDNPNSGSPRFMLSSTLNGYTLSGPPKQIYTYGYFDFSHGDIYGSSFNFPIPDLEQFGFNLHLSGLDYSEISGQLFYYHFTPSDRHGGVVTYALSANPEVKTITEGSFTDLVPEPATWAMMLGGFGAVGMAMRRRQKATVGRVLV